MIKPAPKTIFIQLFPLEKEKKTDSGILITGETEQQQDRGTVFAVGDGAWVKEGDKVLFKQYEAHELVFAGESFVVVKDSDIVAVTD